MPSIHPSIRPSIRVLLIGGTDSREKHTHTHTYVDEMIEHLSTGHVIDHDAVGGGIRRVEIV